MATLSNYIDTSTKSLAIAGIVFILVVALAKYGFDTYSADQKDEDKRSTYLTVLYCILIGLVCALLSLALSKQFCKFGSCDILTEPFPSKA